MISPEQILQALRNTRLQPRNSAPEIYRALKNKPANKAGLHCAVGAHHSLKGQARGYPE